MCAVDVTPEVRYQFGFSDTQWYTRAFIIHTPYPLNFSVSPLVRPLMLKGVVFYTAESRGCLLHSGPGDQALPTEKTQQRRKDAKLHQA